jgi:AcrR family transcriptional regulator
MRAWDATAGRIQTAAVRLVKEEGLEGLNLRALGARPELDITGTAPLYYFGSKVGLLGAVAAQGFDELTVLLRQVRTAEPAGTTAIVQIAVAYARFGLENPRLYQAIHSAELWHSASADMSSKRDWIQAARDARDQAFAEFKRAVQEAQDADALGKDTSPDVAAQILTALVDGFLFQSLEENVAAASTLAERLAYVANLVSVTLTGLATKRGNI